MRSPATRAGRTGLRVLAALVSTLVLVVTGLGWSLLRDLSGGLTTTDVIAGRLGLGKPPGSPQNILLVGVDSRTDAKGRPLPRRVLQELRSGAEQGVLNSDTIILIHVPADGHAATGISIPRDTYVTLPRSGKGKINSVYPVTKLETAAELRAQGQDPEIVAAESSTAGRTALIKTVERLTGVTVDHYAEVNLLGFYNLTNAIGGVEVCLKEPVNEFRSGARFPAGRQTISGGAALAFVRQRYELPNSDFSRIRRQQAFLAAVARKVLSAGTLTNPGKLQALVDVAKESVVLDTGWDVLAFGRQASDLAGGRIEFVTIPIEGADSNASGDVVLVDPDAVRAFVAARTGGAPQRPSRATSPERSEAVAPSRLTVGVRNGTDRSGLAAEVSEQLTDRGYRAGRVDTSREQARSSVHYPPGESDAGDQVARVLGGIDAEQDTRMPSGQLRVYLGSDFSMSDIAESEDDSSTTARPRRGARGVQPATPAAPPPPPPPVTSAGVPCVD